MKNNLGNSSAKNHLHIQLLGRFAVTSGERTIHEAEWKSRRASRLVKLLALAPGHRLHRDQVIDTLWPESEFSAAANNFHQTLHGARRVLDTLVPGSLRLVDGFLSLQASFMAGADEETLSVDVEQFEAAASRARDCLNPAIYQEALKTYQGELLPEDLYEEFTFARRETVRQLYANLLLDLAGLYETRGEYAQGIETLLRLLDVDRSHEAAHTGLMRLYARSGQRQQALRQFQALREALREELDAEPGPETNELYQAILAGQFPPKSPAQASQLSPVRLPAETPALVGGVEVVAVPNNLPAPLSSFIGREAEMARVRALLERNRLVTLTGAGGVGKTQLALQVALEAAGPAPQSRFPAGISFPAGIWFIDLAPLSDPNLVVSTVANTLGRAEEPGHSLLDVLITYLKERRALLLLDNCEHLIEACAALASALLRGAPRLQILATSREALSVPGEAAFRVPSLSFPLAGQAAAQSPAAAPAGVEDLLQYEAVRLFCERAQAALNDFRLTTANAAAMVDICRRLDGIPLAIELAAAQVARLEVTEIAARLDDVFRLLSVGGRGVSERQRTLRATIDWSIQLLSPAERSLLERLSVFAGGWTVADAEAVCSAAAEGNPPIQDSFRIEPEEVLALLMQLTSKSMVIKMESAATRFKQPARYRMLETIRQYARELLAGETEYWLDRHLQFFSRLSVEIEENLKTAERIDRLFQQDAELDNMRAAMAWAFAGGWGLRAEAGLWLAGSMFMKWTFGGLMSEGQAWMEKGLALLPKNDPRLGCLHIKALRVLGQIYCLQYRVSDGVRLMKESIARAPECGDPVDAAISKYGLAYWLQYVADSHYEARGLYEEIIAVYRQEGAYWQMAVALDELGVLAMAESDYARAIEISKESADLFLACGDRWTMVYPLRTLAAAYALQGDMATSRAYAEKTMPIMDELASLPYLHHNPDNGGVRGGLAYYLGDYPLMEAVFQRSLAQGREFGSSMLVNVSLRMLAIANRKQGRTARAAEYALEALRLQEETKDRYFQQLVITNIAGLALDTGQARHAAVLLGAAEALFIELKKPMESGWDKLELARDVETLHAQMEAADFQAACEAGRGMSLEEAIREARAIAEDIVKERG